MAEQRAAGEYPETQDYPLQKADLIKVSLSFSPSSPIPASQLRQNHPNLLFAC